MCVSRALYLSWNPTLPLFGFPFQFFCKVDLLNVILLIPGAQSDESGVTELCIILATEQE